MAGARPRVPAIFLTSLRSGARCSNLRSTKNRAGAMRKSIFTTLLAVALTAPAFGQGKPALPPVPAPQMVPKAGPATKGPYQPQALLPGGIVMPVWPAGSPYLNAKRVGEAEIYTM